MFETNNNDVSGENTNFNHDGGCFDGRNSCADSAETIQRKVLAEGFSVKPGHSGPQIKTNESEAASVGRRDAIQTAKRLCGATGSPQIGKLNPQTCASFGAHCGRANSSAKYAANSQQRSAGPSFCGPRNNAQEVREYEQESGDELAHGLYADAVEYPDELDMNQNNNACSRATPWRLNFDSSYQDADAMVELPTDGGSRALRAKPVDDNVVEEVMRRLQIAQTPSKAFCKIPFLVDVNPDARMDNNVPYFYGICSNLRYGRTVDLEEYDPKKGSWEQFLHSYESQAALAGFSEADCSYQLRRAITGDRAVLVRDIPLMNARYVDYREAVTQALTTQFSHISRESQLENMSRNKNEEMDIYLKRVQQQIIRVYPELKHSGEALFRRVRDKFAASASKAASFRFDLLMLNPRSYDELIEASHNLERVYRLRGDSSKLYAINAEETNGTKSEGNRQMKEYQNRPQQMQTKQTYAPQQQNNRGYNNNHQRQSGYNSRPQNHYNNYQRFPQPAQQNSYRQQSGDTPAPELMREKITCFLCGNRGHFVLECPSLQIARAAINEQQTQSRQCLIRQMGDVELKQPSEN